MPCLIDWRLHPSHPETLMAMPCKGAARAGKFAPGVEMAGWGSERSGSVLQFCYVHTAKSQSEIREVLRIAERHLALEKEKAQGMQLSMPLRMFPPALR